VVWGSVTLAHGVAVRVYTSFLAVVEAVKRCDICSNVYIEVVDSLPRIAVAVGEKYFFRAGNYLAVTVIAIDRGDHVVLKAVATGGRKGLLSFFDYGASRDYVAEVVNSVCRALETKCEAVAEVSYLEQSKSSQLKA
jgi:hypothetical protein